MIVEPTIFEIGSPGKIGVGLPDCDVPARPAEEYLGDDQVRSDLPLPELSQPEVIRHFTHLSSMNYGIDTGFYPLGSCTMKYNPKVHETIAACPGFSQVHPCQPEEGSQGLLGVLYEMQRILGEIGGMDAVTLQPAAGAQGELTAMLIFKRRHERVGEGHRHIVIVPDSSHGTNPATAARCGYEILKVPSGPDGLVDIDAFRAELSNEVAAVMLTNPNTLGLFEKRVVEICAMAHDVGALMYCDGANMNAVLGISRPGDAGFDAMHFNLHKTFSSPHGGGGPGSGPVAVKSHLEPYLPTPIVGYNGDRYFWDADRPLSIGRMHAFHGNVGIIVRAWAYILSLGPMGLRTVSENAVLNANYLLSKIVGTYEVPFGKRCMHEFVVSAVRQRGFGVRALDIAKRLIDYGTHPPTVYFPLIVPEAMMIEPTETVSREMLDEFADAMLKVSEEAESDPALLLNAPYSTPVSRLDEALAARKLELRWNAPGD